MPDRENLLMPATGSGMKLKSLKPEIADPASLVGVRQIFDRINK